MRLAELRLLFEKGLLKSCQIARNSGKWIITILMENDVPVALVAQRGNIRKFVDINSAMKVINEIGFKEFMVKMP